jgi:ABC-type polysaccharide/polyol phosphate export permease
MIENLRELYKHRELLYMLTYRDIKIRYKQSVMGFMWAILMPVLIVTSGVIVRYAYAMTTGKHLATAEIVAVAVKSIPWAFLVSGIKFGGHSLMGNQNLVTKIYFPKEIFPMASVLACLFDALVAAGGLLIMLLILRVSWTLSFFWIPPLLVVLVVLVTGICMLVSAASLFFRDVKYIIEVLLTFGIFFTPVFYDVRMLGDKGKWLLLNPFAPILEGLSECVTHQPALNPFWFAYSVGFAIFMFVGGYIYFKHLEPAFAESI